MEAADTYWNAARSGKLPVIVLVESVDGRGHGLAAAVIDVQREPEVLAQATDPDPRMRAWSAITGVRAARAHFDETGIVRAL